MLPISVCIISKNEEEHIEECCKRLSSYGVEIVLTDTGSTDHTVEIAQNYTAQVFHFDWCDDFAAAKNFCMEKASHDWILFIDCDEYIEEIDTEALQHCMNDQPLRPLSLDRGPKGIKEKNSAFCAISTKKYQRFVGFADIFFRSDMVPLGCQRKSPGALFFYNDMLKN